ncbi:hypothetical protein BK816_01225 [Boudabousia tangfeifanii]|uniref:HTH marR-type domain-containing protein n=1 Tax=Boudabousia tangfeifanii TaxID=1912795 RepID=A0A1D9MIF7_9ACTO|nr:MarR family transcriptional regulator [Boudabousia tangfeifanii]AOZ72085.1 hypothetical protein BK816_01225 [Boudabousia tangfeifanii]
MENKQSSVKRPQGKWGTWQDFIFAASQVLAVAESDLQNPPAGGQAMSLSDFDILASLYQAEEKALALSCLKETVLVTTSGLSRSIGRLVERGWIEKIQSDQDKRRYTLKLTKAGEEALLAAQTHHQEVVSRQFFSAFSVSEMKTLSPLLEKLVAHLKEN